jgi:MerR family transcriptional regulator, light-induced transcriptional regulator
MKQFSIFDIEQLTGIKAHTIRIWELRYNILIPKRTSSNHRYYDGDDLQQVLKIAHLYKNGFKISTIACLTSKELNMHINTLANVSKGNNIEILNNLIECTTLIEIDKLSQLLNQIFATKTIEYALTEIIFPFLNKVGSQWLQESICPVQEHIASNVVRSKILGLINKQSPYIPLDNEAGTILFTPTNDHHEIPILATHLLMRNYSRNVYYAGANVSFTILKYWLKKHRIGNLWVNICTNLTGLTINDYLNELITNFPEMPIYVSGYATQFATIKHKQLHFLQNKEAVIAAIKQNSLKYN